MKDLNKDGRISIEEAIITVIYGLGPYFLIVLAMFAPVDTDIKTLVIGAGAGMANTTSINKKARSDDARQIDHSNIEEVHFDNIGTF